MKTAIVSAPEAAFNEIARQVVAGDEVGFCYPLDAGETVWTWGVWSRADACKVLVVVGENGNAFSAVLDRGPEPGCAFLLLFRSDCTIELSQIETVGQTE